MSLQLDKTKELLRQRDLKATSTRIKLLQFLREYKGAVPFSEIQEAFGSTDRITLYRTLQVLVEKGIIHNVLLKSNEVYYALCGSNCSSVSHLHNHVHFKCNKCETVSCEHLDNQLKIALKDFDIKQIDIKLSGICKSCLQNN